MEENKPKQDSSEEHENSTPQNTTVPSSEGNSPHETEETSASTEQSSEIENEKVAETVVVHHEDRWTKYNRIALWGVFVNVFLMFFTGALFFLNKEGIKAAVKAAKAADSTFGLSKKSFEIENTPYLQVYDIRLQMHYGGIDTVNYSVKSLGNYPIKTFADISYLELFNKHKDQMLIEQIDSSIFNYPPLRTTRYISKEVPLDLFSFAMHESFSGKTLDDIKSGELSLVLVGKIIYLNPENGKIRSYIYQAQLFPMFSGNKIALRPRYFFTYNENFDLPYDTMTFIVPKDQYKFQRAKEGAKYQAETEENEFNRMSEPYFETFINSIDSITTHKIQITYSIVNISETPAEIIGRRTNYYVDTAINDWGISIKPTFDSLKKVMTFGINRMILKNDPVVDKFILTPKPPDKEYPQSGIDLLLKYNRYFYIADEIEFINVATGKKMLYRYIMKINPYWSSQRIPFSQTIYHKIMEEPVK